MKNISITLKHEGGLLLPPVQMLYWKLREQWGLPLRTSAAFPNTPEEERKEIQDLIEKEAQQRGYKKMIVNESVEDKSMVVIFTTEDGEPEPGGIST